MTGVTQRHITHLPISWYGNNAVAAGQTRYLPCMFPLRMIATNLNSNEDNISVNFLVPKDGILSNLCIIVDTAAGAGESYVITVRINGAASALTVTISGAAQIRGNDTTHRVSVSAGDYVTVQIVASAAAANSVPVAFFLWEVIS